VILTAAIPVIDERMNHLITKMQNAPEACWELSMHQQELRDFLEAALVKAVRASPAKSRRDDRVQLKSTFSGRSMQQAFHVIQKSLRTEDEDAANAFQELVDRIQNSAGKAWHVLGDQLHDSAQN